MIDAPIDTMPGSLTGGASKCHVAKPKKSDEAQEKAEKALIYKHLAGLLATDLLPPDDLY